LCSHRVDVLLIDPPGLQLRQDVDDAAEDRVLLIGQGVG
jgi:hypothetical protein